MNTRPVHLRPSHSPGAGANLSPAGKGTLRLSSGPPGQYRLAQLDDYGDSFQQVQRRDFPWHPPLTFRIRARASAPSLPGTWGFGLWNAPLNVSLGFGSGRKLPALPNAVWYFFASPENHLAFCDNLPGHGALAATFQAPHWPILLLAPGAAAIPLLALKPTSRFFRFLTSKLVRQDAAALSISPTEWHEYAFDWHQDQVVFQVDGQTVLETPVSPRGPLGMVIWMDNQFAAWRPDGGLQWGVLGSEGKSWVEFEELSIK